MTKMSVLECFFAVMVVCTMNTTAKSLKDDNMQLTTKGTTQKNHYLPPALEEFCDLKDSTDKYRHYHCVVKDRHSGKWNFQTLKEYIANETVKYKFDIICEGSSNISIEWPFKAKNLAHLEVKNCELEHYYNGLSSKMATNTLNELEHLHFEDCVVIISMNNSLDLALNIHNLDRDYECIQEDTLKYYAFRNNSHRLDTENSLGQFYDARLGLRFSRRNYICMYKKLEHVRINSNTVSFFPEFPLENSAFPSLKVLNLSDNLISTLLEEHKKWYRYYRRLEVLDLSHNLITGLEFDTLADAWDDIPMLKMNISYNKVSRLKVFEIEQLINMNKLFIDFSHNPLNCSCTEDTIQLIKFVNNQSKWRQPKYRRYAFMMDLECNYPQNLKGKRLADLNTEDVKCNFCL